eukprot:gene5812-7229_t
MSGVLQLQLGENERILGDLGYIGEGYNHVFVTAHKEPQVSLANIDIVIDEKLKSVRQVIENLFGRQKTGLSIYNQKFRGDIEYFGDIIKSTYYVIGKIILPSNKIKEGAVVESFQKEFIKKFDHRTPNQLRIKYDKMVIDIAHQNVTVQLAGPLPKEKTLLDNQEEDEEITSMSMVSVGSKRKVIDVTTPVKKNPKVQIFNSSSSLVQFSFNNPVNSNQILNRNQLHASPLNFFNLFEYDLSYPLIGVFNDCTKLYFRIPQFGIRITYKRIIKGSTMRTENLNNELYFGLKYHIILPQREDLKRLIPTEYLDHWVITSRYLPMKRVFYRLGIPLDDEANQQFYNTIDHKIVEGTLIFTCSYVPDEVVDF